ncbi:MAG: CBS domain-containing protein [Clostridia bacterium]|nr:CBS domain-containing protein [Oscillospiraceae bacterium]MBQ7829757.1 CBS domain-containing protein [Clostridia bacterium]MBR3687330.1 CBS domain-containing protein [Clostridia bacterium]
MNIAKIMIPKCFTTFLNDNQTVRQGWEIMTRNGYTAIPVIDAEHHYIGCVSEGDFLRHILSVGSLDKRDMEKHRIKELVRLDFCPPLNIDASEADVIDSSLKQNFVPIVDSRNTLCGILTRRVVIEYLAKKNGIAPS